MSKLSKIFIIIGILFMFLSYNCVVFAETSSTSLSTNATTSSTSSVTQTTTGTSTKSTATKSTSNSAAQYSTAVSASNFDLQLTNILSICLIVVGVLLILLSIAILIRLKG